MQNSSRLHMTARAKTLKCDANNHAHTNFNAEADADVRLTTIAPSTFKQVSKNNVSLIVWSYRFGSPHSGKTFILAVILMNSEAVFGVNYMLLLLLTMVC